MTGVGGGDYPFNLFENTDTHTLHRPQQKPWDSCQEMIRMNQMNAESSD